MLRCALKKKIHNEYWEFLSSFLLSSWEVVKGMDWERGMLYIKFNNGTNISGLIHKHDRLGKS